MSDFEKSGLGNRNVRRLDTYGHDGISKASLDILMEDVAFVDVERIREFKSTFKELVGDSQPVYADNKWKTVPNSNNILTTWEILYLSEDQNKPHFPSTAKYATIGETLEHKSTRVRVSGDNGFPNSSISLNEIATITHNPKFLDFSLKLVPETTNYYILLANYIWRYD